MVKRVSTRYPHVRRGNHLESGRVAPPEFQSLMYRECYIDHVTFHFGSLPFQTFALIPFNIAPTPQFLKFSYKLLKDPMLNSIENQ